MQELEKLSENELRFLYTSMVIEEEKEYNKLDVEFKFKTEITKILIERCGVR